MGQRFADQWQKFAVARYGLRRNPGTDQYQWNIANAASAIQVRPDFSFHYQRRLGIEAAEKRVHRVRKLKRNVGVLDRIAEQ